MSRTVQLLIFRLERRRFALALPAVVRVVRMVELTSFPKAPEIVLGVVNVAGELVPVLDARRRFGLPVRPVRPEDFLLLARTRRRMVALPVDELGGLETVAEEAIAPPGNVVPGLELVAGIAKLREGDLVLIHDLEAFLSLDEEAALDRAVEAAAQ